MWKSIQTDFQEFLLAFCYFHFALLAASDLVSVKLAVF